MPRPYVSIDLDKPRKLRFRHNDLADLEVESAKGIGDLMQTMTLHAMRSLLRYGLRWQDRTITAQQAGDLIDVWIDNGGTFASITEKILEALKTSGFIQDNTEGNAPAEATDDQTSASASTS